MTQPTVLITGGAGYLGGNLCRVLLALEGPMRRRGFAVRSLETVAFEHAGPTSVGVMQGDIRRVSRYVSVRQP